ncbi:glycosyltransferase family 8 protein [Aulographum hederae CBS 113979]|uniref:Glycosyltransferase family 8 protein n=1 Tax=Aulographum hederae CBS 113979 TaxID=1176131 RepID=A0A6G1HBP4_9PEZI|nr:glycosyltransferase family 8 protein [Aulographum hederae CBS 113979]
MTRLGWIPHALPSPVPHPVSQNQSLAAEDLVNWSQFAYTQYVTGPEHLCNSVMIFESLHRLGSRADRVILFPHDMSFDEAGAENDNSKLRKKAIEEYNVKFVPIQVIQGGGDPGWAKGFTKFLVFNQTDYARVLVLDSDGTVLQSMDELFVLPAAPVAMPRAYWIDKWMSAQLVLVEPSQFEWDRVQKGIENHTVGEDYDMEILNHLYGDSCLVIPHRKYDMLSGEFRNDPDDHWHYLGSKEEKWDSDSVWNETKYIHFSDWPFPKPWIDKGEQARRERRPHCRGKRPQSEEEDCRDRDHWLWLYKDFSDRRQSVCGRPYD